MLLALLALVAEMGVLDIRMSLRFAIDNVLRKYISIYKADVKGPR